MTPRHVPAAGNRLPDISMDPLFACSLPLPVSETEPGTQHRRKEGFEYLRAAVLANRGQIPCPFEVYLDSMERIAASV